MGSVFRRRKVKLNVDGSFLEVQHRSRGGGQARNSSGQWLFSFHIGEVGGNAFLAEAGALRDDLRLIGTRASRRSSVKSIVLIWLTPLTMRRASDSVQCCVIFVLCFTSTDVSPSLK